MLLDFILPTCTIYNDDPAVLTFVYIFYEKKTDEEKVGACTRVTSTITTTTITIISTDTIWITSCSTAITITATASSDTKRRRCAATTKNGRRRITKNPCPI